MTPQEKDLITTLLQRLQGTAGQAKDAEAETLIRQAVAQQPDAPYYLVQTVLIQDLSLHNAQNRIAELEQQVTEAQARPAATGGFLGGLFGRSAPPAPAPTSVPQAGPWTRAPQVAAAPPPGYGQPQYAPQGYGPPAGSGVMGAMGAGGGGFLRQAATTAAGVAGGALLFEGISSLFGHQAGAGFLGGQPMTPGLGETVVNNYYGGDPGSQDFSGGGQDYASSGGYDPGAGSQDFSGGQDQGYDDSSNQDFGGGGSDDFSGGSDSSSC
jgi:uncharacterized protein